MGVSTEGFASYNELTVSTGLVVLQWVRRIFLAAHQLRRGPSPWWYIGILAVHVLCRRLSHCAVVYSGPYRLSW